MSIHVSKRVWKHANHRGTAKLLLLAFAEYANEAGVCWPGAATLARDLNETERYTRILIRQLIDSGDLLARQGGGRGKKTVYGVAVGLSDPQREKLNSVLENTVLQYTVSPENSDLQNTDLSENSALEYRVSPENSDLWCTETVISGDGDEVPNSAAERGETPQNPNANHHGNNHESPPPPEPKTQPPRANADGAERAAGGGGGRWREHPVYQLLVQPKYGILAADRLMPSWQDAPPDQVQRLLEQLYTRHYSADQPGRVAGRMYRALEAGPAALLKPAAAAPTATYTPPARAAPTDREALRRALAAANRKIPEDLERHA